MNKYILVIVVSFGLMSCSKPNQLDQLIQTKTADEIFLLSGKKLIEGCKTLADGGKTMKCQSELINVVSNLNKNGFNKIRIEDFTPKRITDFKVKLETSNLYRVKREHRPNSSIFN